MTIDISGSALTMTPIVEAERQISNQNDKPVALKMNGLVSHHLGMRIAEQFYSLCAVNSNSDVIKAVKPDTMSITRWTSPYGIVDFVLDESLSNDELVVVGAIGTEVQIKGFSL